MSSIRWLDYFASLGPLVQMIAQMVFVDLVRWFCLFAMVLYGFALALSVSFWGVAPRAYATFKADEEVLESYKANIALILL